MAPFVELLVALVAGVHLDQAGLVDDVSQLRKRLFGLAYQMKEPKFSKFTNTMEDM